MPAGKKNVSTFEQPNTDPRFSAQESLKPLRQLNETLLPSVWAARKKHIEPGTKNLKTATEREGAWPRSSKMMPDEWTFGNCH